MKADPESDRVIEARDRYFQALQEKAKTADYYRVVQVRKDQAFVWDNVEPSYRKHFEAVWRQRTFLNKVRFKKVNPKWPVSYVLIEDHLGNDIIYYLIWQVNEHAKYDESKNHPYREEMSGVFLFQSRKNTITDQFLKWHYELAEQEDSEDVIPPTARATINSAAVAK